jgi:hypothetical protein
MVSGFSDIFNPCNCGRNIVSLWVDLELPVEWENTSPIMFYELYPIEKQFSLLGSPMFFH